MSLVHSFMLTLQGFFNSTLVMLVAPREHVTFLPNQKHFSQARKITPKFVVSDFLGYQIVLGCHQFQWTFEELTKFPFPKFSLHWPYRLLFSPPSLPLFPFLPPVPPFFPFWDFWGRLCSPGWPESQSSLAQLLSVSLITGVSTTPERQLLLRCLLCVWINHGVRFLKDYIMMYWILPTRLDIRMNLNQA